MGSGYDEVAKAIATNVPRRKVLKLLAGGIAASIGTALVGGTAAAKPSLPFYIEHDTVTCEPNFNQQINPGLNCNVVETFQPAIPWWSAFYPGRNGVIGINGSFAS
jgi:hypothetical protein